MEHKLTIADISTRLYKPLGEIKQVLICIHGFLGSKNSTLIVMLGKELSRQGVIVVSFDLPNHGESIKEADMLFETYIQAYGLINNYVSLNYPTIPVSIFATSFGAYLTLYWLSKNNCNYKAIILRAPAINMDTLYQDLSKDNENKLAIKYSEALAFSFNNNDLVNNFLDVGSNNFYIFQGKKDELVNWQNVQRFFIDKCPNKHQLFFFENANHRFTGEGELEEIMKLVKEILL